MKNPQKIIPKNIFSHLRYIPDSKENSFFTELVFHTIFFKAISLVLEPSGMTVWIVNAAHIKYVPGHKTDKRDSAWICKLLLAVLLKPSYIPPKEQRNLRDLTRYRVKLVQNVASNKNRIIRILKDANIKLSSVLSDTSGVVGTKLIDKLCVTTQVST